MRAAERAGSEKCHSATYRREQHDFNRTTAQSTEGSTCHFGWQTPTPSTRRICRSATVQRDDMAQNRVDFVAHARRAGTCEAPVHSHSQVQARPGQQVLRRYAIGSASNRESINPKRSPRSDTVTHGWLNSSKNVASMILPATMTSARCGSSPFMRLRCA